MSAVDDVMPTASEEPWDVITGADTGRVNGFDGDQTWKYVYAHESGLNLTLSYINAADAITDTSYSDYGVTYTGMEGLTVGYAVGEFDESATVAIDVSTMWIKYAYGSFTIGYQESESDAVDIGLDSAITSP